MKVSQTFLVLAMISSCVVGYLSAMPFALRSARPVFTPAAIESESNRSVYVGTFSHPQKDGRITECAHYVDAKNAAEYRRRLLKVATEIEIPGETLGQRGYSYDRQTLVVLRRVVEWEKYLPDDEKWVLERARDVLKNTQLAATEN